MLTLKSIIHYNIPFLQAESPEGSGNEEFGFIPPPPPPPDGKNCNYGCENCCNEILSSNNAAGLGYRGEKGDRGPRVSNV